MPLFGRRAKARGQVTLVATNGDRLGGDRVPGVLRVAAVSAPSGPPDPDAVLVSGLLLGPFPVQLVQVTAVAPPATWPEADRELPVVVDAANPLAFAIDWASVLDDGVPPPVVQPRAALLGWDPGPGGAHAVAVAGWLASRGFTAGDLGGPLEAAAPGMTAMLDAASARYASVIRGAAALALLQTGTPATGVVAAVQPLSMPPQMLPSPEASMAWLTLQVTPPAGAPYPVTIRFGFRTPERYAAIATVGTELPLRVDPDDPRAVTIDLPALGIPPA